MLIHGREVGFLRTVKATCSIADMCEDGDVKNASKLFEGSYQKSQLAAAKFMALLSEGYEKNREYNEPGYQGKPLDVDEITSLPDDTFQSLFIEAIEAFAGEKFTIETEPVPGKKTAKKIAAGKSH